MEAAIAEKTRLCWNCEGHVALHEENCTYCGVYIGEAEEVEPKRESKVPPPPYQIRRTEKDQAPPSPYAAGQNETSQGLNTETFTSEGASNRQVVMTVAFLLVGSAFFLFGIALMLFSTKGTLTLTWDASYWWGYLASAVAFLALGWRGLSALD